MPRLLMISHVPPLPSTAGQRQRVRHTLEGFGRAFDVTLLTSEAAIAGMELEVADLCDQLVALPSPGRGRSSRRVIDRAAGAVYSTATGLKQSNYDIGQSMSSRRVASAVRPRDFDVMFMHYWHAHGATEPFRRQGVPCVLDMHDLLWRARAEQLSRRSGLPEWWKQRQVQKYRHREEASWRHFDALVAINEEERQIAEQTLADNRPVWYAPMGIHLDRWPLRFAPDPDRPRVAFYGGLATSAREDSVFQCVEEIMPRVWLGRPDAEFWIVGANPSPRIQELGRRERVVVTGFVDDPGEILAGMSAVLCPFKGRFGFRSRLIEVMATGVPVIANPDAIAGMGLQEGRGIRLGATPAELAEACLGLIDSQDALAQASADARHQACAFGFESTYGQLTDHIVEWLDERSPTP